MGGRQSIIKAVVVLLSLHRSTCYGSLPSHSVAFAGGFGSSKPSNSKGKQKRSKKGGLTDVSSAPPPLSSSKAPNVASNDGPKLDKWGLPEATLEDIFPPMPPGTELIPAEADKEYSLKEVQSCLKDHINLELDNYFDEQCIEKNANGRKLCKVRLLHQSPPVLAIDNFFTADECEAVKRCVTTTDGGSYEVNSATFQGALSTRTSTSWFCKYLQVPSLLAKANHLLHIPMEVMEEPQIVRYKNGQEFSWHYDEVPKPQLDNGGQRLATLLVYLNDIESGGGGTVFRDLQYEGQPLTMQPRQGSALLFFPAFGDGRPDDRTLHKGEIMNGDDEKWIIQMWIHERQYRASLPPGNAQADALEKVHDISTQLGFDSTELS